jgi:hypothetical protein
MPFLSARLSAFGLERDWDQAFPCSTPLQLDQESLVASLRASGLPLVLMANRSYSAEQAVPEKRLEFLFTEEFCRVARSRCGVRTHASPPKSPFLTF